MPQVYICSGSSGDQTLITNFLKRLGGRRWDKRRIWKLTEFNNPRTLKEKKKKSQALKEMGWFPKINKEGSAFIKKLTASPPFFQAHH